MPDSTTILYSTILEDVAIHTQAGDSVAKRLRRAVSPVSYLISCNVVYWSVPRSEVERLLGSLSVTGYPIACASLHGVPVVASRHTTREMITIAGALSCIRPSPRVVDQLGVSET